MQFQKSASKDLQVVHKLMPASLRPENKRIAIIAGQLVVGGAERQLYLWLSHLDREKFEPVVLTLHPNQEDYWESPIERLGIPLLRIPRRRSRLARALGIINALRPYKPELIHGWHLFASPYAGLAAKLLGARSLGGVRGSYQNFRSAQLEAKLTLWLADGIVANSSSMARQLRTLRKRSSQNIYEVQNAVEDGMYERLAVRNELSRSYDFPSSGIWLGSVGRFDYGKRFDLLLQVLKLLRQENTDFQCLLIGDGPEKPRLESMVTEMGLDRSVVFTGEIPDARKLLSALDIFCFPSLDEGLPNVVMEAAAAGLPIVSWRLPFIEEILKNGEVARLAEPENLDDFKMKLTDLICSATLRAQLGQAARAHVLGQFTVERYVETMTGIYDELLSTQPQRKARVS